MLLCMYRCEALFPRHQQERGVKKMKGSNEVFNLTSLNEQNEVAQRRLAAERRKFYDSNCKGLYPVLVPTMTYMVLPEVKTKTIDKYFKK